MDLAVEAAESRHLSNFLEQFALRSARMLDADWGAVLARRSPRSRRLGDVAGRAQASA